MIHGGFPDEPWGESKTLIELIFEKTERLKEYSAKELKDELKRRKKLKRIKSRKKDKVYVLVVFDALNLIKDK